MNAQSAQQEHLPSRETPVISIFCVRLFGWRFHAAVLAAILLGLTFSTAAVQAAPDPARKPAGLQAGLRALITVDANPRINVGGTFQQNWQATCYDSNGNPLADTVTFSVSGAPSTGGATATFSPNPVATFTVTVLTVKTTQTTNPGTYNMLVSGTGPVCGSYGTGTSPLDVAPLLNSVDNVIWWFNGEKPGGYNVQTNLKAKPTGIGSYQWNVTTGDDKVEFANGSSSTTTTTASTPIRSKGPNGSAARKDITATVTVNGVASDPVQLTVQVPNSLSFLRNVDNVDATYAYASEIHYAVQDQFGRTLPSAVPLNEKFTSALRNDFAGTDWRRGPAGGTTVNPADWLDLIQGEGSTRTPTPQAPGTPLGNVRVQNWSGQWQIGSATVGSGLRVQTNIWQKFQDHARHRNVVSPAP
jgi:hypothetical protein